MTPDDYQPHFEWILSRCKADTKKSNQWIDREIAQLDEYAPNGSVSFWDFWELPHPFWGILGRDLGEAFGHSLNRALVFGARVTKTPVQDLQDILNRYYAGASPVVLVVSVPNRLIANPEHLEERSEIYTNGPVPVSYIEEVRYLDEDATRVRHRVSTKIG